MTTSAKRGLDRLIASAREAARAILRRPPSDWAGPDEARAAISRPRPIDIDNLHEVVCFPGADAWAETSEPLRKLVERGHRVFCPSPRALCFESLDSLRREYGLGATVSLVPDPTWRSRSSSFPSAPTRRCTCPASTLPGANRCSTPA